MDYDRFSTVEKETAPPNLKELKNVAVSYHYTSSIPLAVWLRTSSRILKHAEAYLSQGVTDQAYILYTRFIDLFAYHLYKHPDLTDLKRQKDSDLYKHYLSMKAQLPKLMSDVEKLNDVLKKRHDDYIKSVKAKGKLIQREREERLKEEATEFKRSMLLNEGNKDIQDKNAPASDLNDALLAKKLRSLSRIRLNNGQNRSRIQKTTYPILSLPHNNIDHSVPQLNDNIRQTSKENKMTPKQITHRAVNFTEKGIPLRTLFVPSNLVDEFLKIASRNTKRKLETCGLLCGKLNRNAFFVTTLVIPEQESTQNTCNTKNEEKLFEVIDNLDLFMLGWIHTHPTQSCFLSSVDLHSQNSYQIMLNEAIAIVCSPDKKFHKHIGVFRLTDPPGVDVISHCTKTGFHPHNEKNLYKECQRLGINNSKTGHAVMMENLSFETKDLRK